MAIEEYQGAFCPVRDTMPRVLVVDLERDGQSRAALLIFPHYRGIFRAINAWGIY